MAPPKMVDVGAHEGWSTRVHWYVGMRPYSRRELALDAAIHLSGVSAACVGTTLVLAKMLHPSLPLAMKAALLVYLLCVNVSIVCSTVYNCAGWLSRRWAARHVRLLKLLDHAGILLLIVGSYSPVLLLSGCLRELAAGWLCAFVSIGRRMHAPKEVGLVDLAAFVALGAAPLAVFSELEPHLAPYVRRMAAIAAALYLGGLVPFVMGRLEGHTALWHLCVVTATGCVLAAHHRCLADTSEWTAASRVSWLEPRATGEPGSRWELAWMGG